MKFFFFLILFTISLPGFSQEALKAQPANEPVSVHDELKKLGYDSIDMTSLSDEKVVALVRKVIKESKLSEVPPSELKALLLKQAHGSPYEKILKNHPKILNCMVDILRSEEAMSSLVGIFLRKGDFKLYVGIWICLIILGILFKMIFFNPDWNPWKFRFLSLIVSLIVMIISVNMFYKIFEKELSPSVKIISKHLGL